MKEYKRKTALWAKPSLLSLTIAAVLPLALSVQAQETEAPPAVMYFPQQEVMTVDIPAGPLTQALNALARQAGVTLSFDETSVSGKTSAGLKGNYTVQQGFNALVEGTGYVVRQTSAGYVLVAETAAQASTVGGSSALRLDKVVVTASGFEQDELDAPATISVISREQIEQRYYSDVTDALRNVPGITITGGGSGDRGADISMRGLPSSYTLLMVDGKRQNSRESRPNGSAGFEQDWLPPMQAVERIEVVRGPMSTLYGSDAIGGVINVITRKVPTQWSGSVTLDTIIQENSDSGNVEQANFYLGGPLVENLLGLQVYGRTYHRDEDNIVDGYEEKDLDSLSARLAFTPTQNHDIIFEAGKTKQERYGHMGKSEPTEDCGRSGCSNSESEHEREYVSLSHIGRWDIGTSDTYFQKETTRNDGRDMEISNLVAKSSLVMGFNANMLTIGAQYENEELDDNTSNQISDRNNIEHSQWAVFAEDEWMVNQDLSITLGVRMDDDENYGSHFSPRLYGVWHMAPEWTLKTGVSTGFRSPSLREITPDWGQSSRGGNVYGNPDLKPETSLNQELGLHYASADGKLRSGLTVFHNEFEDKITRVECPVSLCPDGPNSFGSMPTYRINVDEAITQGVEWTLDTRLTKALTLTAGYTYTDSEQKSGEYKGAPLTQLPKHQVNANLDWKATERLNPWLRVTYRGEESQPTTGPSQNSLVAPDYTFVDMGLSYKVTENLNVKMAVYNLFDEEVTVDEYGYVEDGRRYWLSLTLGF